MSQNQYDLIVIGSGIGGMTVASLAAQLQNKKVLVIEKHYVAGGYTHVFKRKRKYEWDVGIHYIGDMGERSFLRKVFDLITGSKVKWNKMPEDFENFVYPDFTLKVPSNEKEYIRRIIELFPEEKKAIENYFSDIKKTAGWFSRHTVFKMMPPFLDVMGRVADLIGAETALTTTKEYLDKNFKDEKLKALLVSQWGDYGLPPSQSPFVMQSLIAGHYLNGGYFPVGGSGTIADAIKEIVERASGNFLLSHEVEEIIIEDGKAVGVKARHVKKGEVTEFYADMIVSNAGAYNTYQKMIPESFAIDFRQQLKEMYENETVTTNVTVYLGLKDDPRKMGFEGENHWIYSSYDHDEAFSRKNSWISKDSELGACFLSFPSLKNPQAEGHTAELIAFTGYKPFEPWQNKPWKKRGEDYEELKDQIAEKLIAFVEKRYPGFRDMIDYIEVSTPLTNEHFTSHAKGAIYGFPPVIDRFKSDKAPWCNVRTPVKNLLLTGADVSSPGVTGAMMGGVVASGIVLGNMTVLQLFKSASKK